MDKRKEELLPCGYFHLVFTLPHILNSLILANRRELLCATTITTIDYLLMRSLPAAKARKALWKLISLFEIATVNRPVIERALDSKIRDFEDAVLDEAGQLAEVESIVTRNMKDFAGSALKVFDPTEFLAQFNA